MSLLVVRASEDNRGSIERIRDLMIDDAEGRKVPLSYVADVVSSMGPNTINRENVKRKIVISANTSGRDLRSVVDDIRKRVDDEIRLPEGYHIEYGGQFESEQAASRTLLLASLMSIVVIFLLLYVQFKNGVQASLPSSGSSRSSALPPATVCCLSAITTCCAKSRA